MKAVNRIGAIKRPKPMPGNRTVSDVMTRKVHVASAATPLTVLVRLIDENRVGSIPIVDGQGTPIGVVSESDLRPRERRGEPDRARGTVASEVMSSPPFTVPWNMTLALAARLMLQRNVRRLVVVDERGKIAGVVSRRDLVRVPRG